MPYSETSVSKHGDITPEQLHIYNVKEPSIYVVNKVINKYLPYDLSAII